MSRASRAPSPRRRSPGASSSVALAGLVGLLVLAMPLASAGGASPALSCSGALQAAATTSSGMGSAPFATTFDGSACGGSGTYSYFWTFGDGETSTSQDATVTYATAGIYTVSLEVNDTAGDHAWSNITVSVDPSLHVALSATSGVIPLSIVFWANVSGTSSASSVIWQFGDGSTGSGPGGSPVQHTYAAAGNYTAEATVSVQGSSWVGHAYETVQAKANPKVPPPLALAFDPTPTEGVAPLGMNVSASATGGTAPYAATLNFGDGTPDVVDSGWAGSVVAFAHVYELPGEYTITITLTDASGATLTSTAGVLVLGSIPFVASAQITSKTSGTAPFTGTFLAQVTEGLGPYTVNWTFGDGTYGSGVIGAPLTHTFTSAGTYTVVLTVTDADGRSAEATAGTITVTGSSVSHSSSGSLGGASAWWTQNGSYVGVVGLVLVLMTVVGLEERRRHREAEDEARALVDAMESAKGAP